MRLLILMCALSVGAFAQNMSRQYGEPNPSGVTTTAGKYSPVGTYDITTAKGHSKLTIVPAQVTIQVQDMTMNKNHIRLNEFTSTIKIGTHVGFYNTDSFEMHYTTTATNVSPAGKYPITATAVIEKHANANPDNYKITVVPGTLTIK